MQLVSQSESHSLWKGQDPYVRYYAYRHSVRPTQYFIIRFNEAPRRFVDIVLRSLLNETHFWHYFKQHDKICPSEASHVVAAYHCDQHVLDYQEWQAFTTNPIPIFMEMML